jgi:DNA-binding transcriptional LysR family regulator
MQWDARIGRKIKLRDLHILLAVVQAGSMAKAGTQLAVSQPAVSKAISEMEHALGVSLLDRGSRGVEPTRYGRALIKRSLAVFDELRQGIKEIEFLSDPTVGEMSIGSTEPLSAGLVSTVIDRLSSQNPLMSFHVVQGDPATLLRYLGERKVEVALARMSDGRIDEHMNADILYEDAAVVVVGAQSRWIRRRQIALSDPVNERWVLSPPDSIFGLVMVKAFHDNGLEPPRGAVITLSHPEGCETPGKTPAVMSESWKFCSLAFFEAISGRGLHLAHLLITLPMKSFPANLACEYQYQWFLRHRVRLRRDTKARAI